jgi:hypothetical protein
MHQSKSLSVVYRNTDWSKAGEGLAQLDARIGCTLRLRDDLMCEEGR